MTRTQEDIQELIREQAESAAERIRLERMAEALDGALRTDVPYRPQFRAELRALLMAEARRTLVPWYRRPMVWGSSLAVAAAAVVVTLGLRFYSPVPAPAPAGETQVAQGQADAEAERFESFEYDTTPKLTSDLQIPLVHLPDERVADERVQPESLAGVDLAKGVQVYLLQSAPDLGQFQRVAANLGFANSPQQAEGGFWVSNGTKMLTMSADGHVVYADSAAAGSGDVIDEDGARAAAHRFLDRAALPVPDLQPLVRVEEAEPDSRSFRVTYTPRVDGRPVVNGQTVIWLTERSHIFRAEAYVHAREEAKGARPVIAPDSALSAAREGGGGQFGPEADLVYVRAAQGEAVFLQPQWRVFGRDPQGDRIVRYVPALAQ